MTTPELKHPAPQKQRITYTAKPLPEAGFVRAPSILAVYPISISGLYLKIKNGQFPAPKKLGPKTSVWDVADVRKALADLGVEV